MSARRPTRDARASPGAGADRRVPGQPDSRATWGDARRALHRLSPCQTALLLLLARLPFLWARAAARLAGRTTESRTHDDLAALRRAGLIHALPASLWPFRTGRPPALFYPSDLGLACVALCTQTEPAAIVRLRPVSRQRLCAALVALPQLAASYWLLAALAAEGAGRPELLEWEQPWRPPGTRGDTSARAFPAYAALTWHPSPAGARDGPARPARAAGWLLLPDLGMAPVDAYRHALAALARHQHREAAAGYQVPVLVIATDTERALAWEELLTEVTRASGRHPIASRVVHIGSCGLEPLAGTAGEDPHQAESVRQRGGLRRFRTGARRLWERRTTSRLPQPVGGPLGHQDLIGTGAALTDSELWLLDALGRHPFLPFSHLVAYAGWSPEWTRRRRDRLVHAGLARLMTEEEAGQAAAYAELTELTAAGLDVAAARQGLPLGAAVRHNGLAGGGPTSPIGDRRGLVGQYLRHTAGTDGVFIRLHCWARARAAAGGDDSLRDWRGPGACNERHAHPDGFGVYIRDGRAHGFFIEYDRGTMTLAALRAKFHAYHRYRELRGFDRRYRGLPWILVVVPDTLTEDRLARALREAGSGRLALPVLLTTRQRLDRPPDGALGPIWRDPEHDKRQCWPPDGTRQRGQLALVSLTGVPGGASGPAGRVLPWDEIERLVPPTVRPAPAAHVSGKRDVPVR